MRRSAPPQPTKSAAPSSNLNINYKDTSTFVSLSACIIKDPALEVLTFVLWSLDPRILIQLCWPTMSKWSSHRTLFKQNTNGIQLTDITLSERHFLYFCPFIYLMQGKWLRPQTSPLSWQVPIRRFWCTSSRWASERPQRIRWWRHRRRVLGRREDTLRGGQTGRPQSVSWTMYQNSLKLWILGLYFFWIIFMV